MIETDRLKIYSATQSDMEKFIESQTIDILKEAYQEMLEGGCNILTNGSGMQSG